MEKLELKYIAELLRKAAGLFSATGSKTEVRVHNESPRGEENMGGICRTPADSPILRANNEPWAY